MAIQSLSHFLLAVVSISFPGLLQAQATTPSSKPPVHWGYEGDDSPANWSKLDPRFATCATGTQQSPIDIRHANPAKFQPLHFDYHDAPLTIIDNGHTVMVSFPGATH